MTEAEETAFEARADKHFKSHPELPKGRSFMHWNRDKNTKGDKKYRANFDSIFPNAPGKGL